MQHKPSLGQKFLELSAIQAYGIWVLLVSFPLALAGVNLLIDETRSSTALILSSLAIGIVAASYIIRFYLVRNTAALRAEVIAADTQEKTLNIISGGFWWWLITLIGAIAAAILAHGLI